MCLISVPLTRLSLLSLTSQFETPPARHRRRRASWSRIAIALVRTAPQHSVRSQLVLLRPPITRPWAGFTAMAHAPSRDLFQPQRTQLLLFALVFHLVDRHRQAQLTHEQ